MKKLLILLISVPLFFTTCKKEDDVPTIPTVLGCTDPAACNFDPLANTDNDSCLTDYGCTNAGALNYDSAATCDDGSCTYPLAIGDSYQGGRIFYLDGNGGGLILATWASQGYTRWGCQGISISGADETAIGSGMQNTMDIDAGCVGTNAADMALNHSTQGYSDWFLPSRDELNLIYLNLHLQGLTNFSLAPGGLNILSFWSSSEFYLFFDPGEHAWAQNFDNGNQGQDQKNSYRYVCFVRAF